MSRFVSRTVCSLLLTSSLFAASGVAQTPLDSGVTYQGRLTDNGSPANGTYDFSFDICSDLAGTTTLLTVCSNNVVVTNGLFTVKLDMGAATFTGNKRWMRTRVRLDVGTACTTSPGTYTTLTPLRELTATPNARYAAVAGSAANDADTSPSNETNTSMVLNGSNLEITDAAGTISLDLSPLSGSAFGDGHSLDAADGDPVDAVYVDNLGNTGVGTLAPEASLHIAGGEFTDTFIPAGAAIDEQNGFTAMNGAFDVFLDGTTAYVASLSDDSLTTIDVSDPSNPVLLSEVRDGIGGFNFLDQAFDLYAKDDIVYVVAATDSALNLIDVSNPAAPTLLAVVRDGVGGFNSLLNPQGVAVGNGVCYVTSGNDDAVSIINVATPASPTLITTIQDGVGGFNSLDAAAAVVISGSTLFVSSMTEGISIINVSTPSSPTLLATIQDNVNGADFIESPEGMCVSGNHLYVASTGGDNAVSIFDVSNPSAPTFVKVLRHNVDGYTELFTPARLDVDGNLLCITAANSDALTLVDVSNPASPVLLKQFTDDTGGADSLLAGAIGVDANQNLICVASRDEDGLMVFAKENVGLKVEQDVTVEGSMAVDHLITASTVAADEFLGDGSRLTGININDGDANPVNELQTLSFNSGTGNLTISSKNTVDINGGGFVVSASFGPSRDELALGTSITGDDVGQGVTLPFAVNYNGVSYPNLYITTNGLYQFYTTTAPTSAVFNNEALPTAIHSGPMICAFWDDLTGTVSWGTTGTSPNRVFTIFSNTGLRLPAGSPAVFTVLIHEGSGIITVRYLENHSNSCGQTATIGFQAAGGASAVVYPLGFNARILDDNSYSSPTDPSDQSWSVTPLR